MAMGMKRTRAGTTAVRPRPLRREVWAASTSRMPFETAMPTTISIPISAVIEKPCRPSEAPARCHSATGNRKQHDDGSRSDLNCEAMIMNTTMTASPIARLQTGERCASVRPADEVEAEAGARIAAQEVRSRSAAALLMPRRPVCM